MTVSDASSLQAVILDVLEPRLEAAGKSRETLDLSMNLLEGGVLDSFAVLEVMLDIEERAGVTADLGEMDFEKAMTIEGLVSEIARLNSLG